MSPPGDRRAASSGIRRRTCSPAPSAWASRSPSSSARPTQVSLVAAAALGLSAPLARGAAVPLLACALLLAGLWWGSYRLAALDRSLLEPEIGRAGLAVVEVTGPARRSEFAVRVPGSGAPLRRLELDERARLDLPPDAAPPQGAILELVATVAAPRDPEEDGDFDEAGYLRRQGIHVVLRASGFRVVGRRGGSAGSPTRFAAACRGRSRPSRPGSGAPCSPASCSARTRGSTRDLRDSFRASGLYHLLAVSGQNVAYVIAGTILLVWTLGLPRRVGELAALATVAAYVLAVGLAAVGRPGGRRRRARVARVARVPPARPLVLPARRRGRSARLESVQPPRARLPALVQRRSPRSSSSSRGSAGGSRAIRCPRLLAEAIAVSAACGLVTAPGPLAALRRDPGLRRRGERSRGPGRRAAPRARARRGGAPSGSSRRPPPRWSGSTRWLAGYLALCARLVGGLPYAQAGSPQALGVLAALGACVVRLPAGCAVRRPAGRSRSEAWPSRSPLPGAPPPTTGPTPPEGLRITVLDVGQGDAILLQVAEGAVLVDQGPPEADVADQLDALGVDELAALVLTHPAARPHRRRGRRARADRRWRRPRPAHPRRERGPTRPRSRPRASDACPVVAGPRRPELPDRRTAGANPLARRPGARRATIRISSAVVIVASYGTVDALLTADAEGA